MSLPDSGYHGDGGVEDTIELAATFTRALTVVELEELGVEMDRAERGLLTLTLEDDVGVSLGRV